MTLDFLAELLVLPAAPQRTFHALLSLARLRTLAIADDISTMEAGERLVQTAIDKFGRIDGAVCVAGILRERMLFNMS